MSQPPLGDGGTLRGHLVTMGGEGGWIGASDAAPMLQKEPFDAGERSDYTPRRNCTRPLKRMKHRKGEKSQAFQTDFGIRFKKTQKNKTNY